MNKKAIIQEKLTWIIIEFVLVGIFVTGSLLFIANINSSSLYERNYLSRTLALRSSTALASPGKTLPAYEHEELEKFNIFLEQGAVVLEGKDDKMISSFFAFPENKNIQIKSKTIQTPSKIIFERQNNYLTFHKENNIPLLKDQCTFTKSTAQGIIIDPAHDKDHRGIIKDEFIEEKINREIARQIARNPSYPKTSSTRSVETESSQSLDKRISLIKQKSNHALVGIKTIPEGKTLKAYININKNTLQSRKLACNIINTLTEVLPEIQNTIIIPVNPQNLEKNHQFQILEPAEIGTIIEIYYPDINPTIIGENINKGIANYKLT